MNKPLITMGSLVGVLAPIVAVASCSNGNYKHGVLYDKYGAVIRVIVICKEHVTRVIIKNKWYRDNQGGFWLHNNGDCYQISKETYNELGRVN